MNTTGRRPTAHARLLLTWGLMLGAAACASEARMNSHIGEIGPDAAEGLIRRVGNEPFTRTIVDGPESVVIAGPYEPELRRLVGTEVRVTGRLLPEGEFPGPTLEATSYEIASVDGERPWLGTLSRDENGFYLEMRGRELVRLTAVSEELAQSTGGLIWVILDANDGVARYGVLRDPLASGGN